MIDTPAPLTLFLTRPQLDTHKRHIYLQNKDKLESLIQGFLNHLLFSKGVDCSLVDNQNKDLRIRLKTVKINPTIEGRKPGTIS